MLVGIAQLPPPEPGVGDREGLKGSLLRLIRRHAMYIVVMVTPLTRIVRQSYPTLIGGLVIVVLWLSGSLRPSPAAAEQPSGSVPAVVRLALVMVPDDLLRPLLPLFQKQTGIAATIVYTGRDPYGVARGGGADLVISHYGHEGVAPFVTEGFGLWPHPVFANQMAIFGPPSDPARVRGMTSATDAFKRIAAAKAPFLSNSSDGSQYLENIFADGVPRKGQDWYVSTSVGNAEAAAAASAAGGYVLWGVPPFLRLMRAQALNLEPLVVRDPLFQRIMVSVQVNPAKLKGVNSREAKAFEDFLLAPATQAWIAAFRYRDFDQQVWWPAGRHNSARD